MEFYLKGSMLFMLLLCVSFLACTQSESVSTNAASQQFFDLKGYFKTEVQRLQTKGSQVTKTVFVDGNVESHTIDSIDLKRELGYFAGSDINRPAWSDKYLADTLFNDLKQVTQLKYKCTDYNLKVRSIVVDFQGLEVNKIVIEKNTSNSIATSSQTLAYQPFIGYSIESHQKVAMGDELLFKVSVKF